VSVFTHVDIGQRDARVVPGNAVTSLVKAGVRLSGREVVEVPPPLREPAGDHVGEPAQVIERGYALLEEETA
jgi:5-dehydro-4-deoxyglucarate dehydratase